VNNESDEYYLVEISVRKVMGVREELREEYPIFSSTDYKKADKIATDAVVLLTDAGMVNIDEFGDVVESE